MSCVLRRDLEGNDPDQMSINREYEKEKTKRRRGLLRFMSCLFIIEKGMQVDEKDYAKEAPRKTIKYTPHWLSYRSASQPDTQRRKVGEDV
jgi:hypothetical protein